MPAAVLAGGAVAPHGAAEGRAAVRAPVRSPSTRRRASRVLFAGGLARGQAGARLGGRPGARPARRGRRARGDPRAAPRAPRRRADRVFVLAVDLPALADAVIREIARRGLATDAPARRARGGRPSPAARGGLAAGGAARARPIAWRAESCSLHGLAEAVGAEVLSGVRLARVRSVRQLLPQREHDRGVRAAAGAGMSESDAKGKAPRRPRRPRTARPRRGTQLHLDARGRARMVDVGAKATTRAPRRRAGAGAPRTRRRSRRFRKGRLSKGDALAVARLAGILAAKKTSEIVPLAHPIALDAVAVDCALDARASRGRRHGDGLDHRPHRRRDGGADRRRRRLPRALRHGQGARPRRSRSARSCCSRRRAGARGRYRRSAAPGP